MKLYKKICKNTNCGNVFEGTRTQQYCCPDCRKGVYIPKKPYKKKAKHKPCSLNEWAKEARANGTSYGKYVAMQYQEERRLNNE